MKALALIGSGLSRAFSATVLRRAGGGWFITASALTHRLSVESGGNWTRFERFIDWAFQWDAEERQPHCGWSWGVHATRARITVDVDERLRELKTAKRRAGVEA